MPFRLGHRPGLDGLRAIAVGLVVVQHAGELLWDGRPSFTGGPWLPAGFLGVDVFFVLSGFLITGLLVDERIGTGRVRLARFYGRRALRLLPALVAVLAGILAYVAIRGDALGDQLRASGLSMVYVWNWVTAFGVELDTFGLGHLWSLAIEEQFYLVWPAVLLLAIRVDRGRLRVALGLAVLVAVASTLRRWSLIDAGNIADAYVHTDSRIDGVMIGAAIALLLRRRGPTHVAALAVPALLVIMAVAAIGSFTDPWVHRWGMTTVGLCTAIVILAVVEGGIVERLLSRAPLTFVGRWSYELYLCHYPVFLALALERPDASAPVRLVLGAAITTLAVAGVGLFERPFQQWKARRLGATGGVSVGARGLGTPTR